MRQVRLNEVVATVDGHVIWEGGERVAVVDLVTLTVVAGQRSPSWHEARPETQGRIARCVEFIESLEDDEGNG